jgi:hypothetical protein
MPTDKTATSSKAPSRGLRRGDGSRGDGQGDIRGDGPPSASRRLQLVMLGLVLLVLAVPLATMNLDPEAQSEVDNRMLQPLPVFDQPETLPEQLTLFFSDRIGLRDQAMYAYAALNDKAFHVVTHPLYEYGKDDHLFFYYEKYQPDLEYLNRYVDFLAEAQRYCEERGAYFLYVITPEKPRVYPEYLPDTIAPQLDPIDYLVPLLDERGINYLDLAQPLVEAKDEYKVFYTAYDVGHWNSTGAFIGIQALVERIGEAYPLLAVPDFDDYRATETVHTRLPNSNHPIYETGYDYTLINPSQQTITTTEELTDQVARAQRHPSFRTYLNPNRPEAPTLLFFTGSYFNTQDHLASVPFSRSTFIHNYDNVYNLAYYYNLFEPDIVLFDSADYVVRDVYFPSAQLQDASLPESYERYKELPVIDLSVSEAFGRVELAKGDAFREADAAVADTPGNLSIVEPDAQGTMRLTYEPGDTIANYTFAWNGAALSCAYALVNGKEYDVLITDGVLQVGLRTEDLESVDSLTVVGIDVAGTRQYQALVPVARL